MASPVRPADFQALIGTENTPICTLLVNMMKLLYLWYKLVRYVITNAGEFTTDFKNDLCAALNDCGTEEEEETT